MLTAYLDESGHSEGDVCVVAGFFGNESQWQDFLPKWQAAKYPKQNIHMAAQHWGERKTLELIARIGPIPRQCGLTPLFGVSHVSDFADLIPDDMRRVFRGYFLSLYPNIIEALKRIPWDERIKFVLERQHQYELSAGIMFDLLEDASIRDGESQIAGREFIPKGNPLVEPADCLAYGILQMLRDKESVKSQWCAPILGDRGDWVGEELPRERARSLAVSIMQLFRDGSVV